MSSATLTYAYAVLPTGATDIAGLTGLESAPVRVVHDGSVGLAVSDVPAEVAAIDSTTDPQVAAKLALTHYDVVEALFRAGPVLPLRMCTMFSSEATALAAVAADATTLVAALDRVAGAAQWNLKVELRTSPDSSADEATSGADYLRRVGARRREQPARLSAARAEASDLIRQAAAHARDVQTTDGPDRLSASFLVADDAAEGFRTCVARHGVSGDVAVLGPLPPYAFVPRLSEAAS